MQGALTFLGWWIVLSIPVGLFVGRFFRAGSGDRR
jgi:hypothetical protein